MEECLEGQVCLVDHRLPPVEFLEQKHIGSDKNADSSGNDLVVLIGDLPILVHIIAVLRLVEQKGARNPLNA
jgi:hypothetical protein